MEEQWRERERSSGSRKCRGQAVEGEELRLLEGGKVEGGTVKGDLEEVAVP